MPRTVLWAMENVSLMLACAQLGITVCSTSLGVVAEPAIAHLIEGAARGAWASAATSTHPISFVVALLIVVYLHVVLGEMVPKNLAVAGPDRAVLMFGPPLVWVARVVRPVILGLNWLANHALRAVGVEPKAEVSSAFTAEEVQSIVERSQAEGLLEDSEGLLRGAIEFSDRTAGDVMVATDELVTVAAGRDAGRRRAPGGAHRLLPVPGGRRVRAAVGYLHLKDVLYADEHEPHRAGAAVARAGARASSARTTRSRTRSRRCSAPARTWRGSSEDGVIVGVVFLEDILEELVGEVRDAMQREQWPGARR